MKDTNDIIRRTLATIFYYTLSAPSIHPQPHLGSAHPPFEVKQQKAMHDQPVAHFVTFYSKDLCALQGHTVINQFAKGCKSERVGRIWRHRIEETKRAYAISVVGIVGECGRYG